MEVFTSACFIFILYCTEWFGFKQCYALPVPTLLNYYQGSPKQNWNWKFRQMRNPEIYHDKFVFPGKEPVLNIAERSGALPKESTKIFFPDDEPASPSFGNDKSYKFSDSDDGSPLWKIRHREEESRNPNSPFAFGTSKDKTATVDGSSRNQPHLSSEPPADAPRSPLISSSEQRKQLERDKVASSVQDWYQWYIEKKRGNQLPQRKNPLDTSPNQGSKTDPISDQSLVAGLQNQKCPEGQIRLENGECRVKVEI